MTAEREIYDVAICGAGPSGSTCALALEKSGLKVALIEKKSFPRDKVCGDVLATYVPKVLNSIDKKYKDAFEAFFQKNNVYALRLVAPNKKVVDLRMKGVQGYCSSRLTFDAFLFDLAKKLPNVTVFENTYIKSVTLHESSVCLSANTGLVIEAKLVIGCDGAQSIINKQLTDTKVDLKHYAGAVRAYYKNVSGTAPNTIEFHFTKEIAPGYLWIFPMKDNTYNVGLGMISKAISEKKVNLKQLLRNAIQESPLKERFENAELLVELEGFGLPMGSRKVQVSGQRFMLSGDAASLIEPAFGEGIGQAMVSGRYAGWHAAKCFEKNNFSAEFMKGYDKVLYGKLWADNYTRYILQRMINGRSWMMNGIIALLRGLQKSKQVFSKK